MKEKILRFIKRLLRVHSPSRPCCMTCQYGDFGDNSGPCRECSRSNNFIHYKEEK